MTEPETAVNDRNASARARRWRQRLLAGIAVLAAALAVSVGVLSTTSVALRVPGVLSERIEARLSEAIKPGRMSLGTAEVTLEPGIRPHIRLRDLSIFDNSGSEIARLNEIRAPLSAERLRRGAVAPTALKVSGAQITLRRRADGTFDLSLGQGSSASGTLARLLDGIERAFAVEALASLEEITADELTITLEDSRSGRLWQATDGQLTVRQTPERLDMTLAADVFNGTDELASAIIGFRTEKGSPAASLTATFENALAADIAVQSPALAFLGVLDAPISGALNARLNTKGDLDTFAGMLSVGTGDVRPTPNTPPIAFESGQAYVEYNPSTNTLNFSSVNVVTAAGSAKADGHAILQDFTGAWPETLIGQFSLSDVELQPQGVFAEPMRFPQGAIDFRLRLNPFAVDIGQISLLNEERRFHGEGRIRTTGDGWNAALDLSLNSISRDRLLALWPVNVAIGTRSWIKRSVIDGTISDLAGAFRFSTGDAPQLSLSYTFADADVRIIRTLPPVTAASGYASINDESFTLVVEKGVVTPPMGGEIDASGSVFHVPDVSAKPGRAEAIIKADSTITAIMSLLSLPPFELLSESKLPVDFAKGRIRARARIEFDLLKRLFPEDFDYAIDGKLFDAESDHLLEGRLISAPELDLHTDPDGIRISGAGRIGQVPATIIWSQPFGPDRGKGSAAEGSIELSQAMIEDFGIGLPPESLDGVGTAEFSVSFTGDSGLDFSLTSDMRGVGFSLNALDWSKPADTAAELEISGRLDSMPEIDGVTFRAPGLSANGTVKLNEDGRLSEARLDSLQVGGWLDGSVILIGRGGDPPAVHVRGGWIDLRTAQFDGLSDGEHSGPVALALNRLTISDHIDLTSFSGSFYAGPGGLAGSFSAFVNGGPAIEGTVLSTTEGGTIQIRSADAGATLAAANIMQNTRGGVMSITLIPGERKGFYDGQVGIFGVRMVQNSVLTELISAISIVGLIDQLNAGGIWFSDVDADFQITPDEFRLLRLSAIGPSLGISLDGTYNVHTNQIRMQGVVSPIYFLNILGEGFSLGRGGLFGFNFNLSGTTPNPQVTVNPLSILTPGFTREIFRQIAPAPGPSQ